MTINEDITINQPKRYQLSLDLQDASLVEIFETITQKTPYTFSYGEYVLDHPHTYRAVYSNQPLTHILTELGQQAGFDFRIDQTHVSIRKRTLASKLGSHVKIQELLSGTVTDETGQPLPGVNIVEKGTANGTVTDFDGQFSLQTQDPDPVLVLSYIGYQTQEISVEGQTYLEIQMQVDAAHLEEVVLIGYGSQLDTQVTGAIAKTSVEELQDFPISNFDQALAGKLAGVQVLQTTGAPGRELTIKVRGTSTLTAGTEPLYVVDGVPLEDSGKATEIVNMEDIESIQILKDASSAAIYGSRGGNGVVLINTKKGSEGAMKVSANFTSGFQELSKKIDMLDAYQYAQLSKEGHDAAYLQEVPTGSPDDPNNIRPAGYHQTPEELFPYLEGTSGLTDTDWQDAIYRTAKIDRYNISVRGGSSKVNYFVSANHSTQEGIIINSDYVKTSLRANIGVQAGKFEMGLSLVPSRSVENRVNSDDAWHRNGVVQAALAYSPTWPIYNEDGSYNYMGNGFWRIGTDHQHNEIVNPVALARLTKTK